MAEKYDPIPDLAEVLAWVLADPVRVNVHAEAIAVHLGLSEDGSAETIAAGLREALGLKSCRCAAGGPGAVLPFACPVHGIPCGHCGGLENCTDDCGELAQ